MLDFASIDFETANQNRSSICSLGIVIVSNGEIIDKIYRLVRPRPNFYCSWATDIHGLSYYDTLNEPEFPEIWKEIAPKLKSLPLVAHNSPFDAGCLKAVHELYELPYPNYQLHTVAAHIGYDLEKHHHALADAEACAEIARIIL